MDHPQELTTEKSLAIITAMINQARGNVVNNSIYFILWGIVIMLANIGMFVLMTSGYQHFYLAWAITVPAWIFSLFYSWRQARIARTSSHLDRVSAALWIGFGVVVFTMIPFGRLINFQLNPVILLLSAIPTFVSGMIIRFRPLIFGGVSFWILGIVCFLVDGPSQYVIGAIAVLLGFLVPGIMLRERKKINHV